MNHATALVFDLDGTLVDTVYQHVIAWHQALSEMGIELAVWRLHRRIGMSGGLFGRALLRETGVTMDPQLLPELQRRHSEAYQQLVQQTRPLPGARELLARLTALKVPWAIATSGLRQTAAHNLEMLEVPDDVPVITRDLVPHAKPDPDLFLEAIRQLNVQASRTIVVGDSVWDLLAARRAQALGVGLLSGGYGKDELERAGAYRVYEDPAELLERLYELGVREI